MAKEINAEVNVAEMVSNTAPSAKETAQKNEVEKLKAREAFVTNIVQQLDGLNERRAQWEATAFRKANDGLYSLLADCLSIYQDHFIKGDEQSKKELRKVLRERLLAGRVRVMASTTTLTMLTRVVFNSDRKRAHGYAYVLTAAVSHGINAAEFPQWVTQSGGIEEIKRRMVKSAASIEKQQTIAVATQEVKGKLESAAIEPLARVDMGGLSGTYALLLVKPNVDGGADVIGSLSDVNDALLKALIARMAKVQAAAIAEDKELRESVERETADAIAEDNSSKVANG